jgi:hypothetical protein
MATSKLSVQNTEQAAPAPDVPIKRPVGRPTLYNPEVAQGLLDCLEAGYTVPAACSEHGLSEVCFWRWIKLHDEFRYGWEHARAIRAHALAEKTLTISDDEPDPKRAAVRVGARQWMAARLNRQFYGDRQSVELSGGVSVNISACIAHAVAAAGGILPAFRASLGGVLAAPAIGETPVNSAPETVNAAVSPMDSPLIASDNLTKNA